MRGEVESRWRFILAASASLGVTSLGAFASQEEGISASIKKRVAKSGVRYDVRVRVAGRVLTKSFARKHDAGGYAATIEADKLRGVAVDPRRARVTLREFAGP